MKRKLKIYLGPLIIIATIAIFIWYLRKHPKIVDQITNTSPRVLIYLLLLYGVTTIALTLVSVGSLQLFRKKLKAQENFLLTAYTSLLNFFGPGQSGPGFRGAYLKVKHGVLIKQYVFVTLIYYAFYALISGLLLFVASYSWWLTLLLLAAIAAVCYAVIRYFLSKNKNLIKSGTPTATYIKAVGIIGVATALQIMATCVIYFIELHSLDNHITFSQSLAYTGAANFAMFVSITPGAIGFREAFLVFSQHLHHISNSTIIAANVLDRAVYVVFLGLLFVVVLALHANNKLQVKAIRNSK